MEEVTELGLVTAMSGALLAGCGTAATDNAADNGSSASSAEEEGAASTGGVEVEDTGFSPENTYKIGYNYYGPGAYSITTLANNQ